MTIDQQIQRIVENRIRQQPGPYVLSIVDDDVIYIRSLAAGMQTQLLPAFTSGAKYVANHIVWHSSPNNGRQTEYVIGI